MVQRIIKHGGSIKYALEGVKFVLRTENNFQLQVVLGVIVFAVAMVLRVDANGLSLLLFTSFLVLICEMLNTAIEEVVDLATDEWRIKAKVAKDVAAGAALLSAVCAVCVGLLVIGPYFLRYLGMP